MTPCRRVSHRTGFLLDVFFSSRSGPPYINSLQVNVACVSVFWVRGLTQTTI